ncbi:MAG: MFS transporter [Chloroflexi bacterium]|nr:MFS transporter [Chloroflexota bacterium]
MIGAFTLWRPRVYYGWWVVLAATLSTFVHGSIFLYGFSVFVRPLTQEFAWTRTQVSLAVTLATLAGALAGPLAGHLVDRRGPRAMELYATVSLGIGFILMGWMDSLWAFYGIFAVFVGIGYSVGGVGLAPTAAVANWFIRRRSLGMGIAAVGWGPGGLVWPVLLATVIGAQGWRAAAVLAGVAILVLGVPISLLLRHRPERYGYMPDGGPALPAATRGPAVAEVNLSLQQALATSTFWLLAVLLSLAFMVTPAIGLHQVPFLVEAGFAPATAGAILGTMTMASIPARVLFGWLGDRYDKRALLILALLLQAGGLLILATAHALWQLLLYTVVFGTGFGALRPLSGALRADYFGRRSFGAIQGVGASVQTAGTMAAPLLTGWLADSLGSYRPAFLALAALNVVGVLVALLLRSPAHPRPA